ncbi:UbiH/UbiF/VisC/COQ6 family ubiquinone biosynthesis hydroxylase [Geminicoccus roseus]|uniref:UbiH/UbiF/VisC/COQ6 family ubiquinone biosynthesis hydroxylase n=1 Tax=Geminicoccus roseus TaxID=404900 RepID=UPI000421E371|nr:UbiH/UbiF/VisC/COQ6 family ubiquinone biosynthesis hydroxylase [Geminicoccus roseus]
MTDFDVVIVGGGLTGLAVAAGLGQAGGRVLVVEQERIDRLTEPSFDGRVTAIALGSKRQLARYGAWEGMAGQAEPILEIEVGEKGSPATVHYRHQDVGVEPFGWIVENRAIRQALLARLDELPDVQVLGSTRFVDMERTPERVTVTLGAGRTVTAKLLLVTEGRFSRTRTLLGIEVEEWDYHQRAFVCTLGHEKPHLGRAVERFFPDGPFAMLPMTGDRSSIVWALDERLAEEVGRLDDAMFLAEVAERFGDALGQLELIGPRFAHPLRMVMAERSTDQRVALVGDALRGIHPIAGQGWNLALRDVEAIVELVEGRLHAGLDPGDAALLEAYASRRRFDGISMVAITDGINRLFGNDLFPLKLARETGLAVVERLPPLKRLFMRHAMGTLGMPRE